MVIVHGTTFSVESHSETPSGSPHTWVSVQEGTVAVQYKGTESFLTSGMRWSSVPAETTAAAEPSRPSVSAAPREQGPPAATAVSSDQDKRALAELRTSKRTDLDEQIAFSTVRWICASGATSEARS